MNSLLFHRWMSSKWQYPLLAVEYLHIIITSNKDRKYHFDLPIRTTVPIYEKTSSPICIRRSLGKSNPIINHVSEYTYFP